ncbi:MAG: hypothetical protein Q8942_14900 [Bacillota bacterium]|nr:hypothetical protein [Bacillota bacterium]
MANLVKTKFGQAIENFIIEAGLQVPNSPITALKLALQKWKDKKDEQFIVEIIDGLKRIDLKDIQAEKSFNKIYKTLQVIAKATTQEKINRFKKLTINGIVYQNEITENEYELYLHILDNLTDKEFIILSIIHQIHSIILICNHEDEYCGFKEEINGSNFERVINYLKDNKQQIWIKRDRLLNLLRELTGLNKELENYIYILHSKGLVDLALLVNGHMGFEKISLVGQKFMEFLNKDEQVV